MRRAHSLDG